MKPRAFIDTNVLVYADDRRERRKAARAQAVLEELLEEGNGVLSTQVLQEFFVIATRKLGVEPAVAKRKVELLQQFEVVVVGPELILAAIALHQAHAISYWDALIVESAAAGGCVRLITEDLANGSILRGVKIENPFAD